MLYIYFKQNSQAIQTTPIILANLLGQVIRKTKIVSGAVRKLHEEYKSIKPATMPRPDLTVEALKSELLVFERTYIILDALDESLVANNAQLVANVESLGAQLFITSRYEVPFSLHESSKIGVEAKEDDIRAYIKEQIQNNPRLRKFIEIDPSLSSEIVYKLVEKSRGM